MGIDMIRRQTPQKAKLVRDMKAEKKRCKATNEKAKTDLHEAKSSGRHDRLIVSKEALKEIKKYGEDFRRGIGNGGEIEDMQRRPHRELTDEQVAVYNENVDRINAVTGGDRAHIERESADEADELVIAEGELKDETAVEEEEDVKKDEDDTTETEEASGSVAVNVGKRMRMIAAAKNASQVNTVLQMLQQDLAECQDGLEKGWCDENEVAKVEALIERANQRMAEVAGNPEEEGDEMMFELSMLF